MRFSLTPRSAGAAVASLIPGLGLALVIALIATVIGDRFPVVGAPVVAIVLGLVVAAVRAPGASLQPGVRFAAKSLLQISVVLLGTQLGVAQLVHGGLQSLPVMLATLVLVLIAAFFVGKALGIDRDLRRLLGVGTAICGGSAIAALAGAIDAPQADVAYALAAVFLFNVVAVFVFPPLGHVLHLSQQAFGLWAGTAINDTSSVVAAAFAYGGAAGAYAVIVKLTRTTLIVPLVGFYAGKRAFALRGERAVHWAEIVPWFVLWFVAAAALNSMGVIPHAWHAPLRSLALFSIAVALAGVGLNAEYARIRATGVRPLVLGAILWAVIATSALAIAHAVHL
jgi:uncharacterized integral membrane protein (TIGR00698 family)